MAIDRREALAAKHFRCGHHLAPRIFEQPDLQERFDTHSKRGSCRVNSEWVNVDYLSHFAIFLFPSEGENPQNEESQFVRLSLKEDHVWVPTSERGNVCT